MNNNFIISSKRKIDNYIKENSPKAYMGFTRIFFMFDEKKYEGMLSHNYRKYLINGGYIKLRHLKEDIFKIL
jgi:hypothetical protein